MKATANYCTHSSHDAARPFPPATELNGMPLAYGHGAAIYDLGVSFDAHTDDCGGESGVLP